VRGVGWDVDVHAGSDSSLFTAEGELKLALEKREHLLEVVAVRSGAAAVRNVHVDQAVAASRFRAGQKDRVRVTDDADVAQRRIVGVHDG
jgi:hypothetical protein